MSEFMAVFVTTASAQEAEDIARSLLEHNLIACANIFPAIRSLYYWQDSLREDDEIFLMLKSRKTKLPQIITKTADQLAQPQHPSVIAAPNTTF